MNIFCYIASLKKVVDSKIIKTSSILVIYLDKYSMVDDHTYLEQYKNKY